MDINYNECCKYIEKTNDITLFPYQKDIIRGWCEDKEVRTCRCAGRSMLARGFGKYITLILENNNYEADPEVIIPYYRLVECGLYSEYAINRAKCDLTKDQFEKEYCAKY